MYSPTKLTARILTEEFIQTIVTIDAILNHFKAASVIDYFSLDIEGNEFLVMTKFPFETHNFYVATIERPSVQLHNLLFRHKLVPENIKSHR